MFADAKTAYRARNALALLIEQDLQLARWLAGLHGLEARRDVSELVSSMVETGHMLPLLEDRLLTIIEASQVVCPLRSCISNAGISRSTTVCATVARRASAQWLCEAAN